MRKLYFGLTGEDVKQLQMKLQSLGYATFQPTTFFGLKTHLALRQFQKDHKIPQTGVFGITEAGLMGLSGTTNNAEKFFNTAMTFLGKDVTPNDNVDDGVACMETIDSIYRATFGEYLSPNGITVSTTKGLSVLINHPKWKQTDKLEKGSVLLYPSGHGNGNLSNGHIFISDGQGKLYSNSSATGLFTQNYTNDTAKYRYEIIGGYPKYCFRLI